VLFDIMNRKAAFILLAIAVIAALSYWLTRPSKTDGSSKQGARPASRPSQVLNAQIIRTQVFSNTLNLSGTIEPDEQVQLRSELSGVVRELAFQEGSRVRKGQLLFRIDDAELQAQLTQAKTKERLDEENERRAKLLLEKEAISIQEYEVARADYESSKAQSALIQAQLAKTRIYAPFDGTIGLRSVSVGEYLTPSIIVANLMSTSKVKVSFSIPEKYSGMVRPGHLIRIRPSTSTDSYEAKVYAIEPGVEEATRTMRIRAIANNSKGTLVPGSFTRVELPLSESEEAILIPTYAVIPVQDGKQVFLYKGGKATTVPVETENRTANDVLVTSGLQAGDTLITSGLLNIRSGMAVEVRLVDSPITN
jgi:membrane fusion protein (multidrug efflux system)